MPGRPPSTFSFSDGTRIPTASVPAQPPARFDARRPADALAQAETATIQQGVRKRFVVNRMPWVDGFVTLADLHGGQPMKALV